MKKLTLVIRFIAAVMLVGGFVMILVSRYQSWSAGIDSRWDSSAVMAKLLWDFGFVQSIVTVISSVFVFGFSYIVEAAMLYIEKCNLQEIEESNE